MDGRVGEKSTLHDYLRVLRRRKWIVLQAVVLLPAAAVVLSLRQEDLFEASASVLLSRQNIAAAVTGTQDPTSFLQTEEFISTQAEVARSPRVADRTLRTLGLKDRNAGKFAEDSSVSRQGNADVLVFKYVDPVPALAARLATEFARQYTIYRREVDTAAISRALTEVLARLQQLERRGDRSSALYKALIDKEQQLRTLEALQTSNTFVLREARGASQVQPRPARNGAVALALGLVLGVALALLWEALDTRVRSADEIAEQLRLPLLGRLPEPPRRLRREDSLVMLEAPFDVEAEAFRVLRTNLEFVNIERDARVLMVTSALESEGKSTTVANLAVSLARAGKRVVLVDVDLRRPYLDRFFDLGDARGLTHIALGRASLDEALAQITITDRNSGGSTRAANGHGDVQGFLQVLPAGPVPPDVGEFVSSRTLTQIIEELRERADVILLDSPPLLQVGDTIALSAKVDGLIIVTNLNRARRPVIRELRRVLDSSPAAQMGFVVTGADVEDAYYGYAGYYGRGASQRTPESVA